MRRPKVLAPIGRYATVMDSLDSTLPLSEVLVLEAWEAYTREASSAFSVEAFKYWVAENQPETFFIVSESTLVSMAQKDSPG